MFFRLTLVPPRALQLRRNSRWRNSKYWETRSWQTSGEILIFIYFLLFFLPLTQRADEAATPSDGDWQPHPGAHHGVRAAEYDCHTVGNGQSQVNHFQFSTLSLCSHFHRVWLSSSGKWTKPSKSLSPFHTFFKLSLSLNMIVTQWEMYRAK